MMTLSFSRRDCFIGLALVSLLPTISFATVERVQVTDEEFIRIIGHRPSSKDPHRDHEFALMTQGSKRLAYIGERRVDQFIYNAFTLDRFRQDFLVYRPEHKEYADEFREVYDLFYSDKISREDADRRCGELLGYTDIQINTFKGRLDGMR